MITGGIDGPLLDTIGRLTGYTGGTVYAPQDVDTYPYPAWHLKRRINYLPVLTSFGCPFDCAYCASRFLQPRCRRRRPRAVVKEILFWHKTTGVRDFVLYDDAFLLDAEAHAAPILEGLIRAGLPLRFHTPNALHIRGLTPAIVALLARAGFQTVRLGLETTVRPSGQADDHKVELNEFIRAAEGLRQAGFTHREAGAYLLIGLPGQDWNAVADSIHLVKNKGVRPILAYYTPIPHTRMWARAVAASRYDLAADPLFCNNAIFPCQPENFSWEALARLKEMTRMNG